MTSRLSFTALAQFLIGLLEFRLALGAPPWANGWQFNGLPGGWSLPWLSQDPWSTFQGQPPQLRLPHLARPAAPKQNALTSFWLIPREPISCMNPDKVSPIFIDKNLVTVRDCTSGSRTLKFPGCVYVKTNIELLRSISASLFGNVKFQWANLPQVGTDLQCEQQDENGCNGIGNNCYYCDICKGIKKLQQQKSQDLSFREVFECPTKPKVYEFEREFNVSDWKGLDSNNNGIIDLLEDDRLTKIRDYFKAIDVVGFGTLSITFQLSQNASVTQWTAKKNEEARIRSDVINRHRYELDSTTDFEIEQEVKREIGYWNRNSYLPWLASVNQLTCVTFLFDVCLNEPSPFNLEGSYQCA